MEKRRAVLVSTSRRGVFFGYNPKREEEDRMTLEDARMVVYWDISCKGLLGLAANGPNENCKVTPAVPLIEIDCVDSISEVPEEARKEFEKGYFAK